MHITKLFSLAGRSAVVIGGAGKIGLPIVEALGESGARVYMTARTEESCKKALSMLDTKSLDVHDAVLDQSDEQMVEEFLETVSAEDKVPDILVNCGSIRPMTKYFEDSTENWDYSMSVNARGLFVTCRAFGKKMVEVGKGSIINVSSIYGIVAPDKRLYDGVDFETEPDYPFIKGGTIMFSKYLASFWGDSGVRVNCIAPGGFFNSQPQSFLESYTKKVPLNRMVYHDDLKGAVVFLASDASAYVTGMVLPVDGGLTAL